MSQKTTTPVHFYKWPLSDPTVDVVSEIATYFGLLVKNGDLCDALSQLRFLRRETANFSLEWIIVVSSLKVALNRLCDVIYGALLFR